MRNYGIISIIIGLLLLVLKGLPEWLITLIGLLVIVFGLFATFNPEAAKEMLSRLNINKDEEI